MRPSFDRLEWREDRVLLDDLVFRLEQCLDEDVVSGDECFRLYKRKGLIDQYERFFALRDDAEVRSMLELGVWDGGSVAFWHEVLRPAKHVGVDLEVRADSAYFRHYVRSRGLEDRVKTMWGVDQSDADAMREIVATEFPEGVDLVIDDASHRYAPSRASFETLFPLVRPGGLYVIEDWAWGHWPEFQDPRHAWAREPALTALLIELIEVLGSSTGLIADIIVFRGFAAIERGTAPIDDGGEFALSDHITRRPKPAARRARRWRRLLSRVRRALGSASWRRSASPA
jgi:SAM-dependent methyltransferase